MKGKKTVLIISLIFVLLLLAAGILYNSLSERWNNGQPGDGSTGESTPQSQDQGEETPDTAQEAQTAEEESTPAPDFTMQDKDGNSVALSDFIGKPLVLNFWASWCGSCKKEMPVFDALAAEYEGEVVFLLVNLTDNSRETVESASQYVESQGYTMPVYYDTQLEGTYAYGVRAIPVTYFIDAQGNIKAYAASSLQEEDLRQGLEMILE